VIDVRTLLQGISAAISLRDFATICMIRTTKELYKYVEMTLKRKSRLRRFSLGFVKFRNVASSEYQGPGYTFSSEIINIEKDGYTYNIKQRLPRDQVNSSAVSHVASRTSSNSHSASNPLSASPAMTAVRLYSSSAPQPSSRRYVLQLRWRPPQ